jgi:hypothetical protein
MQERGDQNQPYEPGPYEPAPYGQPQDAIPPQYQQPQYPPQRYPQQPYGAPPPGYYQPPIQVNVVQNAGYRPVAVRQGVNHRLHFWLTFFTGGLWLIVWIPLAMKGKKTVVYR